MTGTKTFDTNCKLCDTKCIEGEIIHDESNKFTFKLKKKIENSQFIRKGSHLFVLCAKCAKERPNYRRSQWLKLFGVDNV